MLRELSKLRNKAQAKDSEWRRHYYQKSILPTHKHTQLLPTQDKHVVVGNTHLFEEGYPFTFQGKTIYTYADLLQFCEMDTQEAFFEKYKAL